LEEKYKKRCFSLFFVYYLTKGNTPKNAKLPRIALFSRRTCFKLIISSKEGFRE